jgi:hypothetical protein
MVVSFAKKLLHKQREHKLEKAAFKGEKKYSFEVDLRLTLKEGCKKVKLWQPIPRETRYQKILSTEFSPDQPNTLWESLHGNSVAYWEIEETQGNFRFVQKTKVCVKPRVFLQAEGNLQDYDSDSSVYKIYSREEPHISFKDKQIKDLAKGLRGRQNKVWDITALFYNYVRDNLVYGSPTKGLYSSNDALRLNKVDCGGFSCLLGALLRSVGIPARLLSGFSVGDSKTKMHAWLEFMTPKGNWVPVDPSMEHLRLHNRVLKPGGFGRVGNDRILVSVGSDIKINGKNFPLLQLPMVESVPKESVSVKEFIVVREIK